jgi:DNA mismatch endonuclease (patch repair protein)
MTCEASSPAVAARMRKQRSRDTGIELAVRRKLFSMGSRYRVHYPVPGLRRRSIDIAFPGRKIAVFIDGCFWHGCDIHRTLPASNTLWWQNKLSENRARDRTTNVHLKESGWLVLRFWEHDDSSTIASAVLSHCSSRSSRPRVH